MDSLLSRPTTSPVRGVQNRVSPTPVPSCSKSTVWDRLLPAGFGSTASSTLSWEGTVEIHDVREVMILFSYLYSVPVPSVRRMEGNSLHAVSSYFPVLHRGTC
jgi:hypothetical protein